MIMMKYAWHEKKKKPLSEQIPIRLKAASTTSATAKNMRTSKTNRLGLCIHFFFSCVSVLTFSLSVVFSSYSYFFVHLKSRHCDELCSLEIEMWQCSNATCTVHLVDPIHIDGYFWAKVIRYYWWRIWIFSRRSNMIMMHFPSYFRCSCIFSAHLLGVVVDVVVVEAQQSIGSINNQIANINLFVFKLVISCASNIITS